jgi:hypothetical protein
MPAPSETWCPVYAKDEHELIVLHPTFVADNEDDAWKIGMGSMLVECVLWQVKYLRVQRIDMANTPHVVADLGGTRVALIAGPSLVEAGASA